MFDPKEAKLVPSDEWLVRVADAEDRYSSISVGGLVTKLGMYPLSDTYQSTVFGDFINILRRKAGLTLDTLADLVGVNSTELDRIERGYPVEPILVDKLAAALNVQADKLAQLAGLKDLNDSQLAEAVHRFESKLRSQIVLTPVEESALNEIMQTLNN